MYNKLIDIILLLMTTNFAFSQVRPATQAGRFYEADAETLRNELASYLSAYADQPTDDNIAAIIVPHAGYYYSGRVAASAYARLNPDHHYKRIFLLGPSHHVWLDGASVSTEYKAYHTPLGDVRVDLTTANALTKADSVFRYNPKAHDQEHCLEVQLPFLQMRFKEVPPIVPIIISTNRMDQLQRIAAALKPYLTPDNLFIISSDFSHYPSYSDAKHVDSLTCEALLSGKTDRFVRQLEANLAAGTPDLQTSACGAFAIITLLEMIDDHFDIQHILYRNSGDADNDHSGRVVGYHSFAIVRKQGAFTLTDDEKRQLKDIARQSILAAFDGKDYVPQNVPEKLRTKCGAFVTLNKHGRLRGCIGHIGDDMPLADVVTEMARAAAFDDPRFPQVTRDEWDDISMEISVLTPMQRIHSIDEFTLGRDGLLIRKGYRSGTFLPQVADEVNWTKEEFFGHCSQDKAGLGWNGWRDAELYIYQAIVF